MGGPGSGRRKGGRGGATKGTKLGVTTAKTPLILSKRTGMSLSKAKSVMAHSKRIAKKQAMRRSKGLPA